jgi:DNA repair protein RecN (Recombination protein N)
MISSLYLKNCIFFDEVVLDFDNSLIVFTGPSGAGKSVLMDAMLSMFAMKAATFDTGEVCVSNHNINSPKFDISGGEFCIKKTNRPTNKLYLNSLKISKKDLKLFSSRFIRFLNHKENYEFANSRLLEFLDEIVTQHDTSYKKTLDNYKQNYTKLKTKQKELNTLKSDKQDIAEKIDFLKYEIAQIGQNDIKSSELNDLRDMKKKFQQKEITNEAINDAYTVIAGFHKIDTMLAKMGEDGEFFTQTTMKIQTIIDNFHERFENLNENDIEKLIDRIETLAKLERKYGSLQEAKIQQNIKKQKLQTLENMSFNIAILEKNIKKLTLASQELAKVLTIQRTKYIKLFEKEINTYLSKLYMNDIKANIHNKLIDIDGEDELSISINNTELKNISSGEQNRLKLSLLCAKARYNIQDRVSLFLDEVDANLSGKESEALARVLKELSQTYQIFAISHQPQLTALADKHILVYKQNNISKAKLLNKNERIDEIARIISGQNITPQAKQFAMKLLQSN